MKRVVIADDHAIVREGLKRLVADAGELQVVGEAANGTEVMERVRMLAFDLLLLDLSMPGKSGMELLRWVRSERPALRILVLSMHEELQYAVRAIKAGANGYLTKESAPALLGQALRKVAAGGAWISAEVAEQLALGAAPGAGDRAPHEALSDREFQVFEALVAGEAVSAIAQRLHLSVKTVSTHKTNLMHKLGVDNASDLMRYAMRHGLANPQP